MNSTVLRVLAVFLAIGAIAIGYMGYQAGQQPQTTASAPVQTEPVGEPVVLAANEIAAGHRIVEEDLSVSRVPTRPTRAYSSMEDLIGKKPKTSISTGEMVLSSHFPTHSQLAQSVNPGERAMAVKVDEVIGAGGFLEPGDRVDVLLFLRSDRQEIGENSSAQVVLSNVRVLAFGNVIEPPVEPIHRASESDGGLLGKAKNDKSSAKSDDEKPTGKKSKTTVLAVPMAETSKLMLADSSGMLRLALHGLDGAEETMLAMTGKPSPIPELGKNSVMNGNQLRKEGNNFIQLRELVGKSSNSPSNTKSQAFGPRAVVHKGTNTETVVIGREPAKPQSNSFGITQK